MALAVIGTGFGRTGTYSLRRALEMLGFAPCHHMFALAENPGHLRFWQALLAGERVGWDEVFAGYRAAVDWPSVAFWRETVAHFADAKVIHTTRSPESWHRSVVNTILPAMENWRALPPGPARERVSMARELIVERTFEGRMADAAHAMAVFRAHEEAVRRTVPPERLLVYEVREGWEPLCRFLDAPIPDAPFPRSNTSEEFRERVLAPRGLA